MLLCISAAEPGKTALGFALGSINYSNTRLAAGTFTQSALRELQFSPRNPAQQRNTWLPGICPEAKLLAGSYLLWCQCFLFLPAQPVRRMEMCICHCGSSQGLGFPDITSFNGVRSFLSGQRFSPMHEAFLLLWFCCC